MRDEPRLAEAQERIWRRYREAREYGLTILESRLFAESEADVGELRKLKEKGCPPRLAYKILS